MIHLIKLFVKSEGLLVENERVPVITNQSMFVNIAVQHPVSSFILNILLLSMVVGCQLLLVLKSQLTLKAVIELGWVLAGCCLYFFSLVYCNVRSSRYSTDKQRCRWQVRAGDKIGEIGHLVTTVTTAGTFLEV